MNKMSFKLFPNCQYICNPGALIQDVLWIIVPGLLETPNEPWIKTYCNSLHELGWGVVILNPHWKNSSEDTINSLEINDDVNSYHYQWQLKELLEEWFNFHNKTIASIGFIGFSQGGCQTISFLLNSSLVHKIIHNNLLNIKIYGPILLDPFPPDDDIILATYCPIQSINSSREKSVNCIGQLLENSLIYSVDGNTKSTNIERLPIGQWTAELLGVADKYNMNKTKILVTKNDVNHSDLPLMVLLDVLDYCKLLVKQCE